MGSERCDIIWEPACLLWPSLLHIPKTSRSRTSSYMLLSSAAAGLGWTSRTRWDLNLLCGFGCVAYTL